MFWRKDGEEIHEGVDHREILPNDDETFQMNVDLNVSSVKPEDWRRYDCVFQFSNSEQVITKLDKTVIRTNCAKTILCNDGGERNIMFADIVNVMLDLFILHWIPGGIAIHVGNNSCRS